LVSTLQTTAFFGNPSSGIALQQLQYNTNVGARVAMNRIGGVGASQLGGTYYIQSTDLTSGALVVEELDIQKFPGKVRFSIRKGASYRA
jgi:uridine phosphorylase